MKKIDELQEKIDKLKEHNAKLRSNKKPSSTAFDVAAELVGGVIAGVIIGLMFDNLFDSKPLFLIICIILAITAAFRSIWKKYI